MTVLKNFVFVFISLSFYGIWRSKFSKIFRKIEKSCSRLDC